MTKKSKNILKLPNIDIGTKIANWTVVSYLDKGGAGEVFIVINEKNEEQILKKLKNNDRGKDVRFDLEIKTLYDLKNNPGIITILDDYNSHPIEVKEKWYIVEKGITLKDILNKKMIEYEKSPSFFIKWIFNQYIELLTTLNELNLQNIYHRDIKPENIIYINKRLTYIDFGVTRNENYKVTNLTQQHDSKNLGAKFYMAPEMRREPAKADYSKVDIYSITKTIWASLTGEYFSFDGQYNDSQNWFNKILQRFPTLYNDLIQLNLEKETISRVSNMFYCNTSDLPEERMSISQTIDILQNWLKVFYKNDTTMILSFSQENNDRRWYFLINKMFQGNIPNTYKWEANIINKQFFDIFEGDYFSVFLPNEHMNRLKIMVKENDLILYDGFNDKNFRFEIDYNWIIYRDLEDFSYFYHKFKIKDTNDFVVIIYEHFKGDYAKYYLNGVCRNFGNSFNILNEEEFLNDFKNSVLLFKNHLIKGCPYCLSEYKEKNIILNLQ